MIISKGQGVLGQIRFTDGTMPSYDRPYLVIDADASGVTLLNISSSAGKERKLLFPNNREIKNYNPPFLKPSFVKLDSLVHITYAEASNLRILGGGACLNTQELSEIISAITT